MGGGGCTISWNTLSNAIMLNIDQETQSSIEMSMFYTGYSVGSSLFIPWP